MNTVQRSKPLGKLLQSSSKISLARMTDERAGKVLISTQEFALQGCKDIGIVGLERIMHNGMKPCAVPVRTTFVISRVTVSKK